MSHVAKVEVDMKVDDLDDIEAACEMLGCELVRGQKTYKWYGTRKTKTKEGFASGVCNHAIRVKGNEKAYEIGLVERDGQLVPLWDPFCGGYGLMDAVGDDCKKLKQALAVAKSTREARKQGYRVQRIEEGTKVRLRLTGGRLR